jgi:hypothetical protein
VGDLSSLRAFLERAGVDADTVDDGLARFDLAATMPEEAIALTSRTWPERPLEASAFDQVVLGTPEEVVLTLGEDGTIELAEFEARWAGPAPPPVPLRRNNHRVVVSVHEPDAAKKFVEGVKNLRRRRRRRYRRCKSCESMTPPEHWYGEGLCQSCASTELGVVY